MADLYNTILQGGGKILQDGSAWRDIATKDGAKIIRQFAKQNGEVAVDVFECASGKMTPFLRKTVKGDSSFLTKVFDTTGLKQFFAVQKLGQGKNAFMSALFKKPNINSGDFIHCVENNVQSRGKVRYIPVSKGIMPESNTLYTKTSIFNSQFGKIDLQK